MRVGHIIAHVSVRALRPFKQGRILRRVRMNEKIAPTAGMVWNLAREVARGLRPTLLLPKPLAPFGLLFQSLAYFLQRWWKLVSALQAVVVAGVGEILHNLDWKLLENSRALKSEGFSITVLIEAVG